MRLKNKRVLILQQRGWGIRVGHPLAVRLSREGATLGAVTIKRSTHKFTQEQDDVAYERIFFADDVKEDPHTIRQLADTSLADVCAGLGVDTVWRMVQASRNHVNSYRDRYYYSFRQGQPDDVIIDFVKGTYLHVRRCFDEFRPDLVILPNFAGLQHIMFSLLADRRGIPILAPVDSKIRGLTVISRQYRAERSAYLERAERLRAGAYSENMDRARAYLEANRKALAATNIDPYLASRVYGKKAARNESGIDLVLGPTVGVREYVRALINSLLETREFYRSGRHERLKNFDVTIDFRPPPYIFRDNFSSLWHRRNAERYSGYEDISRVGKYAYFPLQVQPEATINVQAPIFNNQLEVARQVAMALPDDYCLVVKDHPNMTWRRPVRYLNKFARLPNVKLVDFRLKADQILRQASLLVSPSSSTIAEAAFFRIPTIQLGGLGTTRAYPNVIHHEDFSTLPSVIRAALATEYDPEEYDAELLSLIAAAYDVGIENSYNQLYSGRVPPDKKSAVEAQVIDWFLKEIVGTIGHVIDQKTG